MDAVVIIVIGLLVVIIIIIRIFNTKKRSVLLKRVNFPDPAVVGVVTHRGAKRENNL